MAEPERSDLRIPLAIETGGSIAGAARVPGVDQSTVSRRLAALERAFGAVLVIRGGRDFAITRDGRVALDTARIRVVVPGPTAFRKANAGRLGGRDPGRSG